MKAVRFMTWRLLSTMAVTLTLVDPSTTVSGLRFQPDGCTTQMPSPVDPRFCFSTRSLCATVAGNCTAVQANPSERHAP